MSRAEEWNQRYAEGRTGWDLGAVPPVVEREAKARLASASGPSRVLVPGAGKAHDARGWARHGHEVTAVDLAPLALEAARELAEAEGVTLELVQADVTALPDDWTDRFDLVWEQTCLCALPPELRVPYLDELARVLAPGAELLALLWDHDMEGGPPYAMTQPLVESLLTPRFEILGREAVEDSPADRKGEWLWRARVR